MVQLLLGNRVIKSLVGQGRFIYGSPYMVEQTTKPSLDSEKGHWKFTGG